MRSVETSLRHIGVCNFSAGDLECAQGITTRTNRARIVSNQVHYALTCRDVEHEIAPVAKANDVALLVWSPLAGGYLSGKYTQGKAGETGRRTNLNFPPMLCTCPIPYWMQQFHDKDRVLV